MCLFNIDPWGGGSLYLPALPSLAHGFVLKLVALKQDGCFSRYHSRKKNCKKRKTGGIVFLVLKLSLFRSEDFSSHTANFPHFTAQNKCKYKKDWNGEFCFLDSSIDKVKDSEERGTEQQWVAYQIGHLAINIFVYLCYILSSNPLLICHSKTIYFSISGFDLCISKSCC